MSNQFDNGASAKLASGLCFGPGFRGQYSGHQCTKYYRYVRTVPHRQILKLPQRPVCRVPRALHDRRARQREREPLSVQCGVIWRCRVCVHGLYARDLQGRAWGNGVRELLDGAVQLRRRERIMQHVSGAVHDRGHGQPVRARLCLYHGVHHAPIRRLYIL